jgi:hypothetical protein
VCHRVLPRFFARMVRHGVPETFKKEASFPDAPVKRTGNFHTSSTFRCVL